MNFFHVLILSIIEGVTEFLPISSTFHIDLFGKLMNIPHSDFFTSFIIAIQLGAIIAIIILLRKQLFQSPKIIFQLGIAFIPVGIVGLLVYPLVKNVFLGNQMVEIFAVFIGGIIMVYFSGQYQQQVIQENKQIELQLSFKQIFYLSLWQILAFIPGMSRSGSVLIGGLVKKIPLNQVVLASFLLAIPTMITATGYDLWKTGGNFTSQEWNMLIIGVIFSGVVAFFVAKWLLSFLQKPNALKIFGWYRIILAIILIFVFLL